MRIPLPASALTVLAAVLAAAVSATPATAATPVTLDQAMAHPDWIGTPVEAAWWNWDGKQVFYKQKRAGSPVRRSLRISGVMVEIRSGVPSMGSAWRISTSPT